MVPDVAFYNLIHQAIYRAANGSDQLQQLGAFPLRVQCFFNGFHLPAYTSYPDQKFVFRVPRMSHRLPQYPTCAIIQSRRAAKYLLLKFVTIAA